MSQQLSRNKKILFSLCAALLAILLIPIFGEIAVRFLAKRTDLSIEGWRLPMDSSIFSRHVFEPKKRILKKDGPKWQINSLGYRGTGVRPQKTSR